MQLFSRHYLKQGKKEQIKMLKKLKRNLVLLLTAALLIVSVVPAFTASAEGEAGVTVTNTLTDGAVIKSAKKTFFVTARDENGNTVDIAAEFNGKKLEHSLSELLEGSRSHFMIGWLSEAILFNRAMPESCFMVEHYMEDTEPERDTDYYYVRVRQRDQQWAWSSPIWVERI